MRVMVIVRANPDSEAGKLPSEKLLEEMGQFNEELVKSGILLAAEGLHPSSRGKRVRFAGSKRAVLDGPFSETKELIAGFWLWQVKSMEEALAWARRIPNPDGAEGEIEVRPVAEMADLAASDPSGELRKREEALRRQVEALSR